MTANCPYCHLHNSRLAYRTTDTAGDTFDVQECNLCGTFFLSPAPSKDQLEAAYEDTYYGEREDKFNPLVERVLDGFRKKRARLVAHLLKGHGRVLDIGCGNGRFLATLNGLGDFEIHGIEMPGKAAKRAMAVPGLNLKTGVLEPGDFPPASLDAMTLFHVVEHLPNPSEVLDMMTGMLKPGGIAVVSFPNIASRQARWFKGKWLHLDPPRHLWLMPPDGFVQVMRERGFRLIGRTDFSIEYNPFGYQQSLLNAIQSKREALYEFMKDNRRYLEGYPRFWLQVQKWFYLATFPLFILMDAWDALFRKSGTVQLVFAREGCNTTDMTG